MVESRTEDRLTWAEAAVALGCSVRTLQRIKAAGDIGYGTVGASARPHVYFTRKHIEAYLRRTRREPASAKRTA